MDTGINRRLIGASAILSPEKQVVDVDLSGLIRRLLLFDKFVLSSIRLQEFPILARYLGYEGLRDLLAAKTIEIRCECLQLAQVAQAGLHGDPILPLFSYRFHVIDAHSRRQYVHDCLHALHSATSLQGKQVIRLKGAVAAAIRRPAEDLRTRLFAPFHHEIVHNPGLLHRSVELAIHGQLGLTEVPFAIRVHEEASDTLRVETDLPDRAKVSEPEAHKIIERGMMGVAGLSQVLLEMQDYSAISGFRDEEMPLFRHKLNFLAEVASSEVRERDFQRVIDIAGLPDIDADRGPIRVERLLKVRESSDAREFRDWLCTVGQATDDEIRERVASLRAKLGLKVTSTTGKVMRFLAVTGIGLIPDAAASAIGLGVLDQFVIERLLPRSGIAAFVNELYPSIFKSKED